MASSAYIDPTSLQHSAASADGIPVLGVPPVAIPQPGSNNPFTSSDDFARAPVVHSSTGPVATGEIDRSHTIKPSAVADDPPATITSDLLAKEAKIHSETSTSATGQSASATQAKEATQSVAQNAQNSAQNAATKVSNAAQSVSSSVQDKLPTATGIRQRVNSLSSQLEHAQEHPAVQNVKGTAQKQVGQFREFLGRSKTVRSLEQRFNVDRVVLVTGAVLAYILIIPLNLFGLALPTTTFLTLVPPSFLALGLLDSKVPSEQNDAATRALLAYFVTLGFIQFLESLAAGVLEKRIPQYYTVKLVALAYLLHPQTQGAMKLHHAVFRPLFVHAKAATSPTNVNTPPQSKEAGFHASSPGFQVPSSTAGSTGATFASDPYGNVTKSQARGEGFDVITERH